MKASEFCYWLQGYFEIDADSSGELNQEQVATIKRHLQLVFVHDIDPSQGSPEHQQTLQSIHDGKIGGGVDPVTGAIYRC